VGRDFEGGGKEYAVGNEYAGARRGGFVEGLLNGGGVIAPAVTDRAEIPDVE